MLQLTGKCLGVESETRQGPTGSFVSTTIHVLDGFQTWPVRVGKDFPTGDVPKNGEDVALVVEASAFSYRAGGAGLQLTATSRVSQGTRIAAAAS